MTPKAKAILEGFKVTQRQANPQGEDPVSDSTRLQQFIVASGEQGKLSPDELADLAVRAGVPEDRAYDFVDEMASWL